MILRSLKRANEGSHEKPRIKTGNMSTKELPLKPREKREKETDSDFQVQVIEEVEEDYDDDDDLPDLESFDPRAEKFSSDEIVWVMTHGLWWPSFVLRTYPKENKASILFINCQQKTPIKVPLHRLKTFSYLDYSDIFESQKDKAVGLTEAMDMASRYREVKTEGTIKLSPREFFNLSISDQRSIIDKEILALRRKSILGSKATGEDSPKSSSSPLVFEHEIDYDDDEEGGEDFEMKSKKLKIQTPEISDDRLSGRDMLKLASATKARRTSNERFVRYIKSEACLEFLRKICVRKVPSERHDYFVENHRNFDFLMVISGVHPVGLNFFGEDDVQQTEEVLTYLIRKFENEEIIPPLDFSNRKVYVNTVLFPEAVKESLRAVAKIPEEDLETVLEDGLFHTRTELKAKRLDYS